jgi:hypothetical protein
LNLIGDFTNDTKQHLKGIIGAGTNQTLKGRVGLGTTIVRVDRTEVESIIEAYLAENSPISKITINGEGPDENGNFVIEIQSVDLNNVVDF